MVGWGSVQPAQESLGMEGNLAAVATGASSLGTDTFGQLCNPSVAGAAWWCKSWAIGVRCSVATKTAHNHRKSPPGAAKVFWPCQHSPPFQIIARLPESVDQDPKALFFFQYKQINCRWFRWTTYLQHITTTLCRQDNHGRDEISLKLRMKSPWQLSRLPGASKYSEGWRPIFSLLLRSRLFSFQLLRPNRPCLGKIISQSSLQCSLPSFFRKILCR